MADAAQHVAQAAWVANVVSWVGRWLLLVPEAVLLLALMVLYPMLGGPPAIALLSGFVIVVFIVRALALHLARLALGAGRYRDVAALLRVALILYPWSADAQALRGTLALARNEPEEAEQALREAVRLLPTQPSFYVALSSALIELGRPREAVAVAEQALRLDESYAPTYLYLAEAERASNINLGAVEEQLRTGLAIARLPESRAALQCALASYLIAECRYAEASLVLHGAEVLITQCSALQQAELRYLLGELLITQGQTDRAREHFEGAETLDPNGRFAAAAWRAARMS